MKRTKVYFGNIVLMFLLINAGTVLADIMPYPASYGQNPTPKTKTNIQMKSEIVNIHLTPKKVQVEASFEMLNTGPAEKVVIGWPVIYNTDIQKLQVKENDVVVSTEYQDHSKRTEYGNFETIDRWYIWESIFAPKEKKIITVCYETFPLKMEFMINNYMPADVFFYDPETEESLPPLFTGYLLSSGRQWHGVIENATIRVTFEGFTSDHIRHICPKNFSMDENILNWEFKNFEPNRIPQDYQCRNLFVDRNFQANLLQHTLPFNDIQIFFNPQLTIQQEITLFENIIDQVNFPFSILAFAVHLIDLYRATGLTGRIVPFQEAMIDRISSFPETMEITMPNCKNSPSKERIFHWTFEDIIGDKVCWAKNYLFQNLIRYYEDRNDFKSAADIRSIEKSFLSKLTPYDREKYNNPYRCYSPPEIPLAKGPIPADMEKYVGLWRGSKTGLPFTSELELKPNGQFASTLFRYDELIEQATGRWNIRDQYFIWTYDKDIADLKKGEEDVNRIVSWSEDQFILLGSGLSLTTFNRRKPQL